MANIPKTNQTGITDAESIIGQLFNYLNSQNASTPTPQVGTTLPGMGGLRQMLYSLNNGPMQLNPGGGIDTAIGSNTFRSANRLAANPARAAIRQQQIGTNADVMGQNLQLGQAGLFNNMSMQDMIDQYLAGAAGQLGQIGNFPPYLRGMARGVAASGTGSGGSPLSMFGF